MKNPSSEPIAHVAASQIGSLFAAAHYEQDVFVWDLEQRKLKMHLETDLDFGGRRLAVMGGEQPRVIVGSEQGVGLACYDLTAGGLKIWHRPELAGVETITVCDHTKRIGVTLADGRALVVGSNTGQTYFTIDNCEGLTFSGGREAILMERQGNLLYAQLPDLKEAGSFDLDGKTPVRVLARPEGVLVAAVGEFGLGSAEDSETDETHVLSLHSWSGRRQWTLKLEPGQKVLALGRQDSTSLFHAVAWNSGDSSDVEVVSINPKGEVVFRRELEEMTEFAFFGDGEHLLDSDGAVRRLPELKVEWNYLEAEFEADEPAD